MSAPRAGRDGAWLRPFDDRAGGGGAADEADETAAHGTAADKAAADKDLLAAHLAGDPAAFPELVRRHQQRLWAVALRTLGDPDDAADALQDALLSAFRSAASYRGEAAVTTWLHRVVVNACLDRARRSRGRRTVPLPEAAPAAPGDEPAEAELRVDLVRALARLPEHQRVAVVLVDLQDLSVAEAAAVLGVPPGTVKSRCSRGRAALAQLLRPGNRGAAGDVGPSKVRDRRHQTGDEQ
ncbi:MAG: RNA polymerase sigma factor SigM [Actinomycetes bacterium]